jgi:hypothetical protein
VTFACKASWGRVKRGQGNVDVVNAHQIEEALDMSLSERFAEVESKKRQNSD